MNGLIISNLSVRFAGMALPALDIPQFRLAGGTKLAVRGPSGSGKTTFVNMISGLSRPGGGSIAWNGVELTGMPEGRRDGWRSREVGLLMQEFHLFPALDALDNVLLPFRFRNFRVGVAIRERALSLLARVGEIEPRQIVATMSRGQMQRVALARALLSGPKLLIADEPTASLDSRNGEIVGELLCGLAEEGDATLIVVTHDEALSSRMERVIAFERGRIVSDNGQIAS